MLHFPEQPSFPQIGLNIAGILAVIFLVRPWVILPTLVLGVVFVRLRSFYMHSSRDIKRLEGISRSPVFSQLSTSLQGLTTIRAFNAEPLLRSEFDYQQDLHTSTWFAFLSATRWFGVWLDWVVAVYIGVVVYSFLLLGDIVDIEGGYLRSFHQQFGIRYSTNSAFWKPGIIFAI